MTDLLIPPPPNKEMSGDMTGNIDGQDLLEAEKRLQ